MLSSISGKQGMAIKEADKPIDMKPITINMNLFSASTILRSPPMKITETDKINYPIKITPLFSIRDVMR